jgi:ribosome-binding protein aMBF1 (putative translation factor)
MAWRVETLNLEVDEELNALDADLRAKFLRVSELIEMFGPGQVHEPHVKAVHGQGFALWEMRMGGRAGIAHCQEAVRSAARPYQLILQESTMTQLATLKAQWLKDKDFSKAYDALEPEFALAHMLIKARARAGISQAELAQRMQTRQSVVARLEASGSSPNIKTLQRYAAAVGCRLDIGLRRVRADRQTT